MSVFPEHIRQKGLEASKVPEHIRQRALEAYERSNELIEEARRLDEKERINTHRMENLAKMAQEALVNLWKEESSRYKGIPKRKISKRKVKARSQHAKKVSKTRKIRKIRKTRSDKGVKRGPRNSM